jgi:hypothetical protein
MRFCNNIFVFDKDFLPADQALIDEELKGNLYWNLNEKAGFMGYPSFAKWAKATGHEIDEKKLMGVYEDPKIYNINSPLPTNPEQIDPIALMAFYPQKGSPAIDNAYKVIDVLKKEPGLRDLVGSTIPAETAYDFGALEIQN